MGVVPDVVASTRRVAVGERLRRARRTIPPPLAALLGAVLLLGVTWALVVPPFQAPDEQSHFGYVQALAEGPGLPGDPGRPGFSTELLQARDAANSDQTAALPDVKPTWSAAEWDRWQAQDERLPTADRSDGGGNGNPAWSNPPLYYLYAVVPYALASGGDLFARVTLTRLASVLWLLATVLGAWLLAGEVLGRDRLLQLLAAGVAGLLPMVTFISAQIGPDGALYALWTLALWLGARVVKRGAEPATASALLGVVGLAIVVKAASYALVPAALLALAVGLWRVRDDRGRALRAGLGAAAAIAVPVLAWIAYARLTGRAAAAQISDAAGPGGGGSARELISYLWQYYLPRLPFMDDRFPGGVPAYQILFKQGWGAFGWLEVRFPEWLYKLLLVLTAGVAAAAVARLVALRRRVDLAVGAFLLLVVAGLLAGIHWTDYHYLIDGRGNFIQGRYLFPLVGLAGLATAQAVSWLHGRGRAVAVGAIVGGLLALQLVSLALVAVRFYA
ncbi:MAG TPA: DUF2142 domain-containing protein [Conexibacter sp.]|nr:DUF2142 domain-containing protein [Conexibacter sp.]